MMARWIPLVISFTEPLPPVRENHSAQLSVAEMHSDQRRHAVGIDSEHQAEPVGPFPEPIVDDRFCSDFPMVTLPALAIELIFGGRLRT